uniref:Uncharacterized protein n=1 Tax=Panagrolaimus sp. ES5 TaxID=591445 RepID=A0AC34FZI2_9BILA
MSLTLKTYQRLKNGRNFSTSLIRRILSQEFLLNNEWQNRHAALKELNLGGDYEWIAAVQKKFVGGGKASAVDVDAATCLSEESDQLNDIVELVYKLRHTENAADLLPSTEYGLYRLFLKHNAHEELFKVLNDPINYGVFPNYHISALLLSHYIKAKNYPAAAKIASILVQQEMFDNKFLNFMAFYSLVKFCELPAEERIFDDIIQKLINVVKVDLEGLISKLPEEGREENEQFKQFSACIAKLEASPVSEKPISDVILSKIEEIQAEGEKQLMEEQNSLFKNWSQQRKDFVRLQAERVNLKLKIEEIKAEILKKHEDKEKLFYFENRVQWEDQAAEKDKLFEEFNLDKKDESITESEYAKTMFEKAFKPIQQVTPS